MTTKYDDAVSALYRSPLDKFVAERKRLASELKSGGDKAGATRLAGLARPPISAWTVNQLWWESRDTFDELFAAGERLRAGDLAAKNAHREAMTKLRARAETLLGSAGHATTEAMLRRVMTDLAALAAVGSFEPDLPGALADDREPPGFDVIGMVVPEAVQRVDPPKHEVPKKKKEVADGHAKKDADAARERQEHERLAEERRRERERLEQERRKADEARAKKRAERERIETALRRAKAELHARTQEVERLQKELTVAEKAVTQTQAELADLESSLSDLD